MCLQLRLRAREGGGAYVQLHRYLRGKAVTNALMLQSMGGGVRNKKAALLEAQHEELKSARTEAERANRTKSRFLAAMRHDLRTPLNAILGYTRLMELRGPASTPQRRDLEWIRRGAEHLLTLINDVLQFATIEAGRLQFRVEEVPRRRSSSSWKR